MQVQRLRQYTAPYNPTQRSLRIWDKMGETGRGLSDVGSNQIGTVVFLRIIHCSMIGCSIPVPGPGPGNDHREARPRSVLHGNSDMYMIRAKWREGVAKAQPELDQSGSGE
jgi:hypothetical protein